MKTKLNLFPLIVTPLLSFTLLIGPTAAWSAAVATSSPIASEVAEKILKAGGSAADAACAAGFTLNVTQPYFVGIGGGGFGLIYQNGKPDYFDFREEAPASTHSKIFLRADGKLIESWDERNTGAFSVAIPGFAAGCGEIQKKYGKMTWAQIVAPAIKIASDGFLISQMFQEELSDQWARVSPFNITKILFGGASGTGIKKGETLKEPDLAGTLEKIASSGYRAFYEGDLATRWLKEANALGVKITSSDLSSYKVLKRNPIRFSFGKFEGITAPLPSSAGLMVASVLRYIHHYYKSHGTPNADSPTRYIVTLEAISYFGKLRDENLADPSKSKINPGKYLNSIHEKLAFHEIDEKIKTRLKRMKHPPVNPTLQPIPKEQPSTQTHTANISVLDDSGMAVALTSSVSDIFGSGLTVPKFGFILNSNLGDFDAEPSSINAPGPGLRPRSNMSPTLLFDHSGAKPKLIAVVGAAGGALIPSAIVQFTENVFLHSLDPKLSLQAARVQPGKKDKIQVEKAMPAEITEKLKQAGYEVELVDTIWAVLEAVVLPGSDKNWTAVSDPRYDGLGITL